MLNFEMFLQLSIQFVDDGEPALRAYDGRTVCLIPGKCHSTTSEDFIVIVSYLKLNKNSSFLVIEISVSIVTILGDCRSYRHVPF